MGDDLEGKKVVCSEEGSVCVMSRHNRVRLPGRQDEFDPPESFVNINKVMNGRSCFASFPLFNSI